MQILVSLKGMARAVSRWAMVALMGASLTFTGCVTTQQYESLQSQLDEAESENAALRLARQDSDIASRELEGKLAKAQTENGTLQDDVNRLDREVKRMKEEVGRLEALNDALTDQSSGRLSDIANENRKLLEDVMAIREELQRREDALNRLEKDLNESLPCSRREASGWRNWRPCLRRVKRRQKRSVRGWRRPCLDSRARV